MCFGKVIWHDVETRSVNKWNNAWFVSGPQTALIERQQINSVPLLSSPAGVARISAVAGRPHDCEQRCHIAQHNQYST